MADTTLTAIIALQDNFSSALNGVFTSLNKLGLSFNNIASSAKIAFGIVSASIILTGKQALEAADNLTKLSSQTGISTTKLQAYGIAAEATGSDMSSLITAMKMLSEHAQMAAQGSTAQIKIFDELGISVRDSAGNVKNAETLFSEFADRISKTTNSAQALAIVTQELGRGGVNLLPMLKLGSEGIKQLGQDANDAGILMSTTTVQNLTIFQRQLGIVETAYINMLGTFMAQTGITVPKLINLFADFSIGINQFINGMSLAFKMFQIVATAVVGAIVLAFQNIGDVVSRSLLAPIVALEPLLAKLAQFLFDIGQVDLATKLVTGLNDLNTAFKGISASADQTDKAISNMIGAIPGQLAAAGAETKATNAAMASDIKSTAGALTSVVNQVPKAIGTVADTAGQKLRDLNAEAHEIFGGLEQAVDDFTSKANNWKTAWTGMFTAMDTGMATALDDMIMKGTSWKDTMKAIFTDLEKAFIHMVTTMATQWAMSSALNGLGLGGGGNANPNSAPGTQGSSPISSAINLATGNVNSSTTQAVNAADAANVGDQMTTTAGTGASAGLGLGGIGAGLAGIALGTGLAIQGVNNANQTQSTLGGFIGGASAGAMIGSIIPGIGTLIGGAIGGIIGGITGFFGGAAAKRKKKKQQEEAAAAAAAAREAALQKARTIIRSNLSLQFGGGLASISSASEIGKILSGGVTDNTIEQLAASAQQSQAQQSAAQLANNVQVGSPNIYINATIAGSYDVQKLGSDLGAYLGGSLKSSISGGI